MIKNIFFYGDCSNQLDKDEIILFIEPDNKNDGILIIAGGYIVQTLAILWVTNGILLIKEWFYILWIYLYLLIWGLFLFFTVQRFMITNKGVYPEWRPLLYGLKNKKYRISFDDIERIQEGIVNPSYVLVLKNGKKIKINCVHMPTNDQFLSAIREVGIPLYDRKGKKRIL